MHLQGLDTLAHDLAYCQQKSAEYLDQIQDLELRLKKAEDIIKTQEEIISSYQLSPSGSNNVVLL